MKNTSWLSRVCLRNIRLIDIWKSITVIHINRRKKKYQTITSTDVRNTSDKVQQLLMIKNSQQTWNRQEFPHSDKEPWKPTVYIFNDKLLMLSPWGLQGCSLFIFNTILAVELVQEDKKNKVSQAFEEKLKLSVLRTWFYVENSKDSN